MSNNIDNAKKGGFLLNRTEQILRIAEQNGIIRGRDIEKTGISRNYSTEDAQKFLNASHLLLHLIFTKMSKNKNSGKHLFVNQNPVFL